MKQRLRGGQPADSGVHHVHKCEATPCTTHTHTLWVTARPHREIKCHFLKRKEKQTKAVTVNATETAEDWRLLPVGALLAISGEMLENP